METNSDFLHVIDRLLYALEMGQVIHRGLIFDKIDIQLTASGSFNVAEIVLLPR